MSKLRFGFAGAGMIATKNVKAMEAAGNIEILFVGSRDVDKAKEFATTYQIPRHGTLEEVCDDKDIDAIYFCVPTAVRQKLVLRALANGKHCLVEKPQANASEAVEMFSAAPPGVTVMDGTMWLQATRTEHLRKLLHEDRKVGQVRHIHAAFTALFPKEAVAQGIRGNPELEPGGGLADMGWYSVGAILWGYNYELPERVRATGELLPSGATYQVAGTLEFSDGRIGQFDAGYGLPLRQYFEISGSEGMLRVDDFVNPPAMSPSSFIGPSTAKPESFWLMTDSSGVWVTNAGQQSVVPDVKDVHEVEMFRNFVESVKSKTPNERWKTSCIKTQIVIDALLQSVREDGAYVPISKSQ
eukprot:TRINITY_DN2427_c0_g1_i1.p1 TRINITY_DN2427_c0_g1~~TRINITY_DN2427_c0_g1_i1.p1  ORF type:complete len:368 (+),score=82.25 TRINITY_DN2427_c0_g1_i1:39-1106(+)